MAECAKCATNQAEISLRFVAHGRAASAAVSHGDVMITSHRDTAQPGHTRPRTRPPPPPPCLEGGPPPGPARNTPAPPPSAAPGPPPAFLFPFFRPRVRNSPRAADGGAAARSFDAKPVGGVACGCGAMLCTHGDYTGQARRLAPCHLPNTPGPHFGPGISHPRSRYCWLLGLSSRQQLASRR